MLVYQRVYVGNMLAKDSAANWCHTHRFEGNNPVDDDENGQHGADVPKTHHGMFQIYKNWL